ncbi:MAG: hypothetical protein QME75_14630 [Deltaproteobacteria bacterium]|nr:hypothetical protein [Desulfitobacteriaceae bacterium]MDI6854825.1 hypothetical protein [Deltaproteobacteria bacterium]
MASSGKTPPEEFFVRLGQDEIGLILNLKESLDHSDQLVGHGLRYQELGWQPKALSVSGEADLGVDFSQPEELVYEQIKAFLQTEDKINLGVSVRAARLLVVEICDRAGSDILSAFGNWRSSCWAQTEDGWEQHYFHIPPGFSAPRTGALKRSKAQIKLYGTEGLVLAPPSTPSASRTAWQWHEPPWVNAPPLPGEPVWRFLKEWQALPEQPDPAQIAELPSWDDIFQRIEPFNELIKALVAPAVSFERYYEKILNMSLGFLIPDPTLLLGLLWHAPRGDLKECPQRWLFLQNLAASASTRGLELPAADPPPSRPRGLHAALASLHDYQEHPFRGAAVGQVAAGGGGNGQNLQAFGSDREVVLERSRYEAMLAEMTELSKKSVELERRLEEQEARLKAPSPAVPPPQLPPAREARAPSSSPVAMPEKNPGGNSGGPSKVLREFVTENPDLASQVQMLQFYMKNYIDINPENHGLPYKEKLNMAAKMVRDFLGM